MNRSIARLLTLLTLVAALGLALPASGALGAKATTKQPTATGTGGAVATVDLDASQVGMQVLRDGGNATDAAVATAAALGVTEPYSCGIGGGGFMVVYDAKSGRVSTIDSRETAPAAFEPDSFIDPATGAAYSLRPARHERARRRGSWHDPRLGAGARRVRLEAPLRALATLHPARRPRVHRGPDLPPADAG